MENPFYVKQKVYSYNWSNIILYRLTSYQNSAQHGQKESYESYSEAQKYYYLETQKCIAAQRDIIIKYNNI